MVKAMRRASICAFFASLLSFTGAAAAQDRGAPGGQAALAANAARGEAPAVAAEEEEEPVFGEEIELYDPSGQSLGPLHDALRGADRGTDQARIVVYGASHVAADFFTNVLRERLQERFGDAGQGFIMPARPWRRYRLLGGVDVESNRSWDALRIRASSREVDALGVAGMAVESDRASAFGRIDTDERTAKRFDLYYLEQPDGGSFDVLLDGRRVERISTASDELGPGYAQILADEDARHVLEVRPRGDGRVRLFGASVEREQPGVIVDNMGINGARAVSHLLWDEAIHTAYLRRMQPDLVVLAYGTNESGDDHQPIEEYEADLRRVVARVRGTVPGSACMLVGPSDRPMRGEDGELVDRPRTHEIIEVQRRVSRDMGCSFFDLVAFGGGPLSMLDWTDTDPPYAQRDHVHFTVHGYLRLGEVLHSTLLEGYDDAPRFDPPAAVAAGPRP